MKRLLVVCLFLLFNNSNAQTLLGGEIRESLTHKQIAVEKGTFINIHYHAFSDAKGNFKINFTNINSNPDRRKGKIA